MVYLTVLYFSCWWKFHNIYLEAWTKNFLNKPKKNKIKKYNPRFMVTWSFRPLCVHWKSFPHNLYRILHSNNAFRGAGNVSLIKRGRINCNTFTCSWMFMFIWDQVQHVLWFSSLYALSYRTVALWMVWKISYSPNSRLSSSFSSCASFWIFSSCGMRFKHCYIVLRNWWFSAWFTDSL